MDPYLNEWLNVLLRWLHVVAAIAWIGASFYFIQLDLKLRTPRRREEEEQGIAGEYWGIHGGGFYHTRKFRVAPRRLPEHLHWASPWPAYTTWLSGLAMFVVLYYWNADTYLIDESVADLTRSAAIGASLALLAVAWLVYDPLCRLLARRELVLGGAIALATAAAAFGVAQLFGGRAAYVQVGAMLGTVMAANVLFVIVPAHRHLVAAKKAGRAPDPEFGAKAKQRSVHNTYLTLPVLFAMLGNHFPIAYGHEHGWAVLVVIMAVGAWIRHFFILRQRGRFAPAIPVGSAAALAAVAVWIMPSEGGSRPAAARGATVALGERVFASAGCGSCHTLREAGATGTTGPNLDVAEPSASLVADRVRHGGGEMPSFEGRLSDREIEAVAAYVSSSAR